MKKHLLILGTASLVALSTLAQAADTKQPVGGLKEQVQHLM